jgi:hypothetical protein
MKSFSKYTIAIFFLTLITLSYSQSQLQSSSSIGGSSGAPMRMGFGARGMSMGNAMTSLISGDIQAYYNPALTPFETVPIAVASYGLLSLDRKLNFLSFTKSIKPNAGLSLAVINSGVTNIDGRDRDGIHTETYSTSENAFMLSFGLKPAPRFAIGATVKILYFVLFEEMKSTTAAIDIGVIYLLTDDISLGAVFQDIKGKYHWNSTKLYGTLGRDFYDYFPLRKRIGISWIPKEYHFNISSEVEVIGSAVFFRIGSEYELYEGLHLRCGIDQIALNADLPVKPGLGLSFETQVSGLTPVFQYAYIFEPYSVRGIHIISLAVKLL